MKKQLLCMICAVALLWGMSGCSTQESEPSAASEETVKIGVLIPGPPTDGGFNEQGADAAEKLAEKGYEVALVEVATAMEIKAEAEQMANAGYKIIFGHGAQCATPFSEISADYTDTWFVTLNGSIVSENQFGICVCGEEGFYVMGVIGAMLSKSGILASQLAGDYPAYRKAAIAYRLGAESVDPDIKTINTILSAPNTNEAYECTLLQIDAGADIIMSCTNEAQPGAMKAVKETPDIYTFGSLGDCSAMAPGRVVGNAIADFSVGYQMAVDLILKNEIEQPEILYLTMQNDAVEFVWDENVKATLPQEIIDAAERAVKDIRAGKIDVPNEYEVDGYELSSEN